MGNSLPRTCEVPKHTCPQTSVLACCQCHLPKTHEALDPPAPKIVQWHTMSAAAYESGIQSWACHSQTSTVPFQGSACLGPQLTAFDLLIPEQ